MKTLIKFSFVFNIYYSKNVFIKSSSFVIFIISSSSESFIASCSLEILIIKCMLGFLSEAVALL